MLLNFLHFTATKLSMKAHEVPTIPLPARISNIIKDLGHRVESKLLSELGNSHEINARTLISEKNTEHTHLTTSWLQVLELKDSKKPFSG